MPLDTPPEFLPPTPPVPEQAVPAPPELAMVDHRPDAGAPPSSQVGVSTLRGPTPEPLRALRHKATSFWLRWMSFGAASFPLVAVGGSALAQDAGLVEAVGSAPGTWIHVVASAIQMLLFLGMRWLDQRGNDYTRVMGQLDESSRKLAQTVEDLADTRSTLKVTEVELRLAKERMAEAQALLHAAQSELRDAREALAREALTRDSDR